METQPIWQNLLLGALAILVIFWMWPGVKASLAKSRQAKSDWKSLVTPLTLVVLFVIILIMLS